MSQVCCNVRNCCYACKFLVVCLCAWSILECVCFGSNAASCGALYPKPFCSRLLRLDTQNMSYNYWCEQRNYLGDQIFLLGNICMMGNIMYVHENTRFVLRNARYMVGIQRS